MWLYLLKDSEPSMSKTMSSVALRRNAQIKFCDYNVSVWPVAGWVSAAFKNWHIRTLLKGWGLRVINSLYPSI